MKKLKILKQTLKQKAVKLKEDTKKKPVNKDRTWKLIKLIPKRSRKWNLATGIYEIKVGIQLSGALILDIDGQKHDGRRILVHRHDAILKTKRENVREFNGITFYS